MGSFSLVSFQIFFVADYIWYKIMGNTSFIIASVRATVVRVLARALISFRRHLFIGLSIHSCWRLSCLRRTKKCELKCFININIDFYLVVYTTQQTLTFRSVKISNYFHLFESSGDSLLEIGLRNGDDTLVDKVMDHVLVFKVRSGDALSAEFLLRKGPQRLYCSVVHGGVRRVKEEMDIFAFGVGNQLLVMMEPKII